MASRLMVSLSDEMLARVEFYANLFGIPKSSVCTMFIGQSVISLDKSYSLLDGALKDIQPELSLALAERFKNKIEQSKGAESEVR